MIFVVDIFSRCFVRILENGQQFLLRILFSSCGTQRVKISMSQILHEKLNKVLYLLWLSFRYFIKFVYGFYLMYPIVSFYNKKYTTCLFSVAYSNFKSVMCTYDQIRSFKVSINVMYIQNYYSFNCDFFQSGDNIFYYKYA